MHTQLIAIDPDLVADLVSTLEATRIELARANERQAEDRLLTVEQAHKQLHVSRSTLNDYMKKKEIIPSEYGNRIWVPQSQIDAFIARHKRTY